VAEAAAPSRETLMGLEGLLVLVLVVLLILFLLKRL
jgi:hypothetical protein